MKTMYIIRGIPGSGKTTLAEMISKSTNAVICEADNYFMEDVDDGTLVYNFKAHELNQAHAWCKKLCENVMKLQQDVIVSNTSAKEKFMRPYIDLAKEYGYNIQVITCQSTFKNIHDVPDEVIEKYERGFQYQRFDI